MAAPLHSSRLELLQRPPDRVQRTDQDHAQRPLELLQLPSGDPSRTQSTLYKTGVLTESVRQAPAPALLMLYAAPELLQVPARLQWILPQK